MPAAHFECPLCGARGVVTYRTADVGGPSWPPTCGAFPPPEAGYWGLCRGRLVQAPRPGDFGFDLRTDGGGGKTSQKFTIHRQVPTKDGLVQVEETISSLHDVQRIERDSEQRYRNGEGEPLRFRAVHQNASNLDVNSFGTAGTIGGRAYDSGAPPQKSGKVSVVRHGTEKPKIPVAKGGGVTALKR